MSILHSLLKFLWSCFQHTNTYRLLIGPLSIVQALAKLHPLELEPRQAAVAGSVSHVYATEHNPAILRGYQYFACDTYERGRKEEREGV